MNPPKKHANSITQYSFTEKNVFGNVKENIKEKQNAVISKCSFPSEAAIFRGLSQGYGNFGKEQLGT